MISANDSLLKYGNPVFICNSNDKKPLRGYCPKASAHPTAESAPARQPKLKTASSESIQQDEEILNAMLPPREWMEGNQLWVQPVSSAPCTRADLLHLEEQLDKRLQQRQARQTGICPVRRELYSQLFDELIRQVTINCAERGLLLLRVRNEILITISAYQTLYESIVSFGLRKAMKAVQDKHTMEKRISALEKENVELQRRVSEEKAKYEENEKGEIERRELEETEQNAEIQTWKDSNQQLQEQLKAVITPKKKKK